MCRRLTSTITISIHAPREGCDVITKFRRSLERDFNPRTPRGVRREVLDNGVVVHGNSNPRTPRGVRPRRKGLHWITDRFQSTHPARGATAGSWPTTSPNANFNPRTPRGVRRHRRPGRPCSPSPFQSTHPARGGTWPTDDIDEAARISIHAPREGCDMARSGLRRLTWISIHAPREGCDACPVTWSAAQRRISIHAPREGCDGRRPDRRPSSPDFNPRTPRGVRLGQGPQGGLLHCISIHAPREGCDELGGA